MMIDLSKNSKGVLYASGAGFLWGLNTILIKWVLNYMSPVTIAWYRFLIAFVFISVINLSRKSFQSQIIRKPPFLVIISGILLGLNYICFMKGIQITSPNNAAVFIQSGPLLLAFIGFIVYKERLKVFQIAGFLIAIGGFVIFYYEQLNSLFQNSNIYIKGVSCVLLAGVMWASYSVIQKELIKNYQANYLNFFNFGIPMIMLLPVSETYSIFQTPWYGILVLVILGVITFIAYYFLSMSLKFIEANKTSIIITCNPIITFIVMAILSRFPIYELGSEYFSPLTMTGAFLVISGAVIVSFLTGKKNS